ncbi:MAG TPA: hypothetical protein VH120_05175 [Gemmataceae bacterium]|nr:hypothetical protein [Gemmataceae bacterium]
MKKLLSGLIMCGLAVALVGCQGGGTSSAKTNTKSTVIKEKMEDNKKDGDKKDDKKDEDKKDDKKDKP